MPKTTDMTIPENLKCLIYGDPGSGKTYTLGTAPKPMYILDTDNGVQTLAGVPGIEYNVYKPTEDKTNLRPIQKLIAKINSLVDECPYETVALDSATNLAKLLQYRIITMAGRWDETNKMRIQDWGALKDDMAEVFESIQSIDSHVIVTGHNRVVQPTDEDGNPQGETLYLCLSEAGQAYPQKAPADFDEIYKMDVQTRPRSGTEYRIMTESDRKWTAKSRLNYYDPDTQEVKRVLDKYENNDLTEIIDKVTKARKQ